MEREVAQEMVQEVAAVRPRSSVYLETCFRAILWSEMSEDTAPEGRPSLARRFKRWEKWKKLIKSRRDDRVRAYPLQRCDNCPVFSIGQKPPRSHLLPGN